MNWDTFFILELSSNEIINFNLKFRFAFKINFISNFRGDIITFVHQILTDLSAYFPNKYYIFPIYIFIFCIFDFDHNWIHYRARHPNFSSRPRSYSSNSYYSCAEQSGSSVIHQGHSVRTKEDKIIMTPVTPDQSIRGLDSTWSVVQGSGTVIAISIPWSAI